MFDIRPIKPFTVKTEKEEQDRELLNAIYTAINMCGFSGEDVMIIGVEVLKRIGRYDLLSPCEIGG